MGKLNSDEDVDGRVETLTVDQWYRYWMRTFKSSLASNTQRNYRDRYERDIKPRIGKMKITDVKAMHCQQIINAMDGRYASSTIYQTYICMGSMLKSAMMNDIIPKQPLNGVVMPKVKKRGVIHFLTIDEQNRFVEAAKKTRNAPPLLRSRWNFAMDRNSGELHRLRQCQDFEPFLNFRTGEPTKNSSYDTNLYKICESAGIKPFCMHALRHTFATRCIERGVKPKALQKILGHSNLSTTMDTYVHMTDESLEEAMEIFSKNCTPIL